MECPRPYYSFGLTVAVFTNDDGCGSPQGIALFVFLDAVVFGAVEEHYHVGVLLDGVVDDYIVGYEVVGAWDG